MIVVQLKGGLGNQMFQYAASRRLAHRNKTNLYIDLGWFELTTFVDAPREYELSCFNIEQGFVTRDKDFVVADHTNDLKTKVYSLTKGLIKPRLTPFIEDEEHYHFDERVLSLPNNTYLDGFWHSEKYFMDIRNILLRDFSFKSRINKKNNRLLKDILASNSVSLHVRRGDYVSNKATSIKHGLMGSAYYKKAVELISEKIKDPKFYVFSDDPEWCKENLKLSGPTVYVGHNKDGAEDMRLMSNCRHNIIANSSFSWWGAWLNQNDDKTVVSPRQWFNDPGINTKDVLPKSWLKI